MRKNKFLAALAIAACLATSVPFSVNAATPGQATDASKVKYGTVSTANQAVLKQLFDATYYKKNNPDLAAAGITTDDALFNHFVKCGVFEGRACCEGFNVSAYKSAYPDLQAAFEGLGLDAYYVHFVNFGKAEKRSLVTVEACAKAGIKVTSAADGSVVSAPAAAASTAAASTATSTETKVEEDAVKAVLAKNVKLDEATGKFYDSSKGDESKVKTTLGLLDGFVAVGGKYYEVVKKEAAFGYDSSKYGMVKVNDKEVYYDNSTQISKSVAATIKVDPDQYILVDTKYYPIDKDGHAYDVYTGSAWVPNVIASDYTYQTDRNGKVRFFEKNTAKGAGYSIEKKNTAYVDANGTYYVLGPNQTGLSGTIYGNTTADLLADFKYDGTKWICEAKTTIKPVEVVDKNYTYKVVDGKKRWYNPATVSSNQITSATAANYPEEQPKIVDPDLYSDLSSTGTGDYHARVIEWSEAIKDANVASYFEIDARYKVVEGKVVMANASYTAEEAADAGYATRKAVKPYVDFATDADFKDLTTTSLTGIHKEVDKTIACKYNDDNFATKGDVTYYKNSPKDAAEIETYVANDGYVNAGTALTPKFYKVVDTDKAYVLKSGYGETKVDGKAVYYSKDEVDASVAKGTVQVAADGYVLVDGNAYPEVKVEDAFEKKEGYKVTKNAEDGLYYYTK